MGNAKSEANYRYVKLTLPASSPLYYLTGLTSLLESIALIIDQHQPVVEKYYGAGRMRAVIGKLQAEGDRVVQNLIEGWEEERRVGRLVRIGVSPWISFNVRRSRTQSNLNSRFLPTHLSCHHSLPLPQLL